MKIRRIVLLLGVATVLISCGGSKKVITSRSKEKRTPRSEVRISKEEKIVSEEKKKILPALPYAEKVQNYIYEYSGIAKQEMLDYGIPASITLAQGILESGAGYGDLTQKANNHFGIKCHGWEGEKVYHDDDRSQECFRKYDRATLSFRDHSLFLTNRKRYSKLFTYRKDDYKSWAKGLRAAGYATDKKYPSKLISIIERYQLYNYDKEVLKDNYKPPVAIKQKTPSMPIITSTTPSSTAKGEYIVRKGDTLYSIAKRHQLQVEELKAYNNLNDNTIAIGQALRVKPDDNDGLDDF